MADTVCTVAIQDVTESRRTRVRTAKLTFTTDNYVAGGVPLDLSGVTNPNNLPCAKFGRNPTGFDLQNWTPGYVFYIVPGTALATGWKVKIYQQKDPAAAGGADIPLQELPATAMPSAIVNDTAIRVAFSAPKNV